MTLLRVATYNVHGHKGTDGRVITDRTFEVVRHLNVDCVALQEFVNAPSPTGESLLEHWAHNLRMHGAYVPSFERGGEEFGNALLTRWPLLERHAHDVSLPATAAASCSRPSWPWRAWRCKSCLCISA